MSINFLYSSLFSICAFFIILIIFIRYFILKKNVNRNKYFSYILISNMLYLLSDFLYCGLIDHYKVNNTLVNISCRLNSYLVVSTLIIYIYYIFIISVPKKVLEKYKKKVLLFFSILFLSTCLIAANLNINANVGLVYNYTGSAVVVCYITASIVIMFLFLLLGKGMKTTNSQKKCYALIIFSTILYFVAMFLTGIDFNAQPFLISFLTISLYFNVESQDSQTINKINEEMNDFIQMGNEASEIIANTNIVINDSLSRIEFSANVMNNNMEYYLQNKDLFTMKDEINNIKKETEKINKYSMITLNKLNPKNIVYTKEMLHSYFYNIGITYNLNIKNNIDDKFPNNIEGDLNLIETLITETINGLDNNVSIIIDYEITYNDLKLYITFNSNNDILIDNLLNKKIVDGLIELLDVIKTEEDKQLKYEIKQKVVM